MKAKRFCENAIHGWFLLMGLVTVGCVLLITVYLIISGIPAIREIGLVKFLFGPVWDSNAAEPQFGILSFILTSVYGTAGAIVLRRAGGLHDRRISGENGAAQAEGGGGCRRESAGGHPLGGLWSGGYAGAGAGLSGRYSIYPTAPVCWRPSSCWRS